MELKLDCEQLLINCMVVLIVPYGIETGGTSTYFEPTRRFNRTLWN